MNQIHEENPPLRDALDLWLEDNQRRGLEKGMQQGLAQGLQSLRTLLAAQLHARFGPLPAEVHAQLAAAAPEQLQPWGLRVVTAGSRAEVVATA